MTKCLVIFPPQWSPFSPHLAPVAIAANIRKAGYKCDVLDLNIDFYTEVLKKDFLENLFIKSLKEIFTLKSELKDVYKPEKKPQDYTLEEQIKIKKLLKLNGIQESKLESIKYVIDNVESAVSLLHDKTAFYNLTLAANSLGIINRALEILSLSEFPQELSLYYYKNDMIKFSWEDILKYCNSENIFSRFYKNRIMEIIKNKYDLIGISISSVTQFNAALVLAKLLKSKARRTKICLGGNHISRVTDALKQNPDFFKIFADFVVFEEGERPTLELIEHISGKRPKEDVSSLIYLDNKQVKFTEKKPPIKLSEMAIPEPKDFPINKYFLPEIIMPVQLSRGCYWKKCTFCDHYFGQTYNVKNIDSLVKELKLLHEKYGINNFEFTDDCISPAYLKTFSEKIIESDLKINWYCDLRLENELTQEILDLAYKAGLKMVLWGYEAGSKRIMELINKGIDIDNRMEIMERAAKAGIYNFAYIFTGFPTETREEIWQTINTACHNPDIIHSYGTGLFSLGKHSLINSSPEKFGIVKLEDDEEFASEAKYIVKEGLTKNELKDLEQNFLAESLKESKNKAWLYLLYREPLFLYIVKHGRDKVTQMQYSGKID